MREQDQAKVRQLLMTMTELEAAAHALLEDLERTRDDMRRVIINADE